MKARIESYERLYSGEYRMCLLTSEKPDLDGLKDKDVKVSIKQYRASRSLDANAYYWTILSKVAEAVHISKPFAHNVMLRKYGQLETWDGKHLIMYVPDTDEAGKKVDEDEYVHLKPTSGVKLGNDGVMYRAYKLIRGSSTYDTKEMSELISGLVSEADEMGIKTITPLEAQRMKEQWGIDIEFKNKVQAVR